MKYKIIIAILLAFTSFNVAAQRTTIEEYVEQFKGIAMDEMKRTGVPAAITLAQGILESENGNGELVKKSNNHFCIIVSPETFIRCIIVMRYTFASPVAFTFNAKVIVRFFYQLTVAILRF